MTKAELVVALAKDTRCTKAFAERAVNSVLGTIRDSLRKGRRVTLAGFGTFWLARRAARDSKNPRTGKTMRIPAARVPRFKPSKTLKSVVR
jgi:DNA-binding protein HU-beta